jgi:hypothetical protein
VEDYLGFVLNLTTAFSELVAVTQLMWVYFSQAHNSHKVVCPAFLKKVGTKGESALWSMKYHINGRQAFFSCCTKSSEAYLSSFSYS